MIDQLTSVDGLAVSQQREMVEIFTGFEGRNKYVVMGPDGRELYMAVEEDSFFLIRWFLRALRPFTIDLYTLDQQSVLRVIRPFRFYFHEAQIEDADGRLLGRIQRRFAILRRKYDILDDQGRAILQLFGPLLRPWTFVIQDEQREYGAIMKKWSGLLKEGFTDADNFGVQFPADWPLEKKAVLLGAVFLIDFVHFENKG